MRCQAESDGTYYAAEIVQVSTSKNRKSTPVKISFNGYEGYDEWVGGDRLRSKALKVAEAPEKEKKERPERKPAQLAEESEIAVKRVARVYTLKVADEAAALKVDKAANEAHILMVSNRADKSKGYLKICRQVCKTEWAYELAVVFDTEENFKLYDESEWRKDVMLPIAGVLKEVAVGDSLYTGVRVYNELGAGRP